MANKCHGISLWARCTCFFPYMPNPTNVVAILSSPNSSEPCMHQLCHSFICLQTLPFRILLSSSKVYSILYSYNTYTHAHTHACTPPHTHTLLSSSPYLKLITGFQQNVLPQVTNGTIIIDPRGNISFPIPAIFVEMTEVSSLSLHF